MQRVHKRAPGHIKLPPAAQRILLTCCSAWHDSARGVQADPGPPPKLPHHSNGSAIKEEDSTAALLKLGLSPAAIAGVDLDRLRAMLPADFFQPRRPLVDGVKPPGPRGEKPSQMEAWAAKMQTHM